MLCYNGVKKFLLHPLAFHKELLSHLKVGFVDSWEPNGASSWPKFGSSFLVYRFFCRPPCSIKTDVLSKTNKNGLTMHEEGSRSKDAF